MKIIKINVLFWLLMAVIIIAGCNKAIVADEEGDYDVNLQSVEVSDGDDETAQWDDEKFCSHLNVKDFGETVLIINEFLSELSNDLTDEQKLQKLTTWLKSFSCIIDATVACYSCHYEHHPTKHEVCVSFYENGKQIDFILDIDTGVSVVFDYYSAEHLFFYNGRGNKERPVITSNRICIKFTPDADVEQLIAIISSDASLQPTEYVYLGYEPNVMLGGKEPSLTRAAVLESKNNEAVPASTVEAFMSRPEVISVSYEYQFKFHTGPSIMRRFAFSDEFIVSLKETTSFAQLQDLATQNHCMVGKEIDKNRYVLTVSKTSELDAVQTANLFFETGLFAGSTPHQIYIEAIRTYEVFDPLAHEHDYYYLPDGEKMYFVLNKRSVIKKVESENGIMNYNWVIDSSSQEINLNDILKMPGVLDAAYGLRQADVTNGFISLNFTSYLNDRIWIRIDEGQSIDDVLNYAGISEIVVKTELTDEWHNIYLITLNVKMADIFRICRDLYESGLCVHAIPSWYISGNLN